MPSTPSPHPVRFWSWGGMVLLGSLLLATAPLAGAAEPPAAQSVAAWQLIAASETKEQSAAEIATGSRVLLLEEWGFLYNCVPVASLPHFSSWWKERGETTMRAWLSQGCPLATDHDHVMCYLLALYDVYNGRASTLLGSRFSTAEVQTMADLVARIENSGGEVMRAIYLCGTLSSEQFTLLRFYAIKTRFFWGRNLNMPYDFGLSGPPSRHLVPGDVAPEIVAARLDSVLHSPAYSDQPPGQVDFLMAFHTDITTELLGLLAGYSRSGTSDTVVDRRTPSPFTTTTLSDSRKHGRPAVLIFTSPNDTFWWAVSSPSFEALHQQTKDRMDWFVVNTTIHDPNMANVSPLLADPDDEFHETTIEERARRAKAYCLSNPEMSIPFLLDDMANHAENAYLDLGGETTVFLVDKDGIITFDSRSDAIMAYTEPGGLDFQLDSIPRNQSALELNIALLLANHGIWNHSPAAIPDWQRSDHVDTNAGKGVITAISPQEGTMTVTTSGKDLTVTVDRLTRIIAANAYTPGLTLANLTLGAAVYVSYDTIPTMTGGHRARLVQVGGWINSGMYWTLGRWLPARVMNASNGGEDLTVEVRMGPKPEMIGYGMFMAATAGAAPKPPLIALIDTFATLPPPRLHMHLDRSTEVVVNGMRAQMDAVRVGDQVSCEIKPGLLTASDGYFATFIRVHRY